MKVIKQLNSLQEELSTLGHKQIGYVPTMGALHNGHLSLIDYAHKKSDYVVVSIFVNPTQFNNENDLQQYPINLENDILILKDKKVDMVFCPDYNDLYASESRIKVDLKGLDKVLEGERRLGHFEGVIRVLNLFFRLIHPKFAFFGEKDYQQFLIVDQLTKQHFPNIKIIPCPTQREANGLAMSSRNIRLSPLEQKVAAKIYSTLLYCKQHFDKSNIRELEASCFKMISEFSDPEYFEIRNANDLSKVSSNSNSSRAFVATKLSDVRLIDNIAIN